MKTADLYVRVSTDEQAAKGYSPRAQEDVLRRHCEMHDIAIRKVIHEDYSAKTFNRPEWKKLIENYRMNSSRPDYILFVKWDRFSRNAPDAYQMIATLNRLKVEPQAIEQPLDLSVPENKMMLAIYLTAPEIENDRRSLNVRHGMHQAKKEGRWMGHACAGYLNKTRENGDKYIAIDEPQAKLMKWAFEQIAENQYTVAEIWREVAGRGLKCTLNSFWKNIRNVAYCGRILVNAYGKEPEYTVIGQHQAIISEKLFYEVQDSLDGRKRDLKTIGTKGITMTSKELLPLRGFLSCPICSKRASGSASRSKQKRYHHYYHCTYPCKWREKAATVNIAFVQVLKQFVPKPGVAELFSEIVSDLYNHESKSLQGEKRKIINEINNCHSRINKARELLLNDVLSEIEYKNLKEEMDQKMIRLEASLDDLQTQGQLQIDIEGIIYKVLENLKKLDLIYLNADIVGKRQMMGSIFYEKWTFSDGSHRTPKVNEVVDLIYQINSNLGHKKRGFNIRKNIESSKVPNKKIT